MNEELDNLFLRAREIPDLEARAAFLDEACRDEPGLRLQVEQLLADERPAESYFAGFSTDGTAAQETRVDDPAAAAITPEQEGQWIGRYRLLQQIGEGGFGSVWMAEQTEPVSRKVALKIIKAGMDTREVIARFEAERQALAMMDHPHIAKVLDAGATDTGRPYFVMELVKGIPVTEFCARRQLDTRQRLELFGEICSAINHAHQKGIVHRDIKPSNVLVTLHGEMAVPMVIDFGIAKATQGKLTDKTLFTRFNQLIGTPAYMSPEQVGLSGLDIDTRSDIYSLGVLLYEMLSGCPPFDPKTLLSAGWDEMRRIIREVDPPRPSLRLSTATEEEHDRIQTRQGVPPQKLGRILRGELDWIVMKAMEKDRERRYETANAFADDIKRYLANEPVLAAAPGAGYRFRKFARRNKVALSVALIIAVSLFSATAVSSLWAIRATKAEQRVSGLLDEARVRQTELTNTIALLTESTEELETHMRRFLIGDWEVHARFDPEAMQKKMKPQERKMFDTLFAGLAGDMSSKLRFNEDGSATGETVMPAMFQAMTPLLDKKRMLDGKWDLIKQQGKKTTVKISSRDPLGLRIADEFTITVVDSDTLLMENPKWADNPMKPIITFKRTSQPQVTPASNR
jgi:serine/threonine protein kinase